MSVRKILLAVACLGLLACLPLLIPVVWPPATFRGHTDRILAVVASPDGKLLVSASADKNIKLWDVATRKEQATLRGTDGIFSSDGNSFAWADGKTIRLWDVNVGMERGALRGHTDTICSLAFSADGKTLASGSFDTTVKLWDLATGKERATYRGHTSVVDVVRFSPDGFTLASRSCGPDQPIKLWDARTAKEQATLPVSDWYVESLAFSPGGQTLASGGDSVRLWDVAAGTIIATLDAPGEEVGSLVFSPDGKTLAAVNLDSRHEVYLWEILSGKRTAIALERSYRRPRPRLFRYVWDTFPGIFQDHAVPLSVWFNSEGQLVAFGVDDRDETTVKMWRIAHVSGR